MKRQKLVTRCRVLQGQRQVLNPGGKLLERDIEEAGDEYSIARVGVLKALKGNPYHADVKVQPPLHGLLVASTSSPMMNRICGDVRSCPDALTELLPWFAGQQCVAAVPLIFPAGKATAMERVGEYHLRR